MFLRLLLLLLLIDRDQWAPTGNEIEIDQIFEFKSMMSIATKIPSYGCREVTVLQYISRGRNCHFWPKKLYFLLNCQQFIVYLTLAALRSSKGPKIHRRDCIVPSFENGTWFTRRSAQIPH